MNFKKSSSVNRSVLLRIARDIVSINAQLVDSMLQKIKSEIDAAVSNHVRDAKELNADLEELKELTLDQLKDYGLECEYIKDKLKELI